MHMEFLGNKYKWTWQRNWDRIFRLRAKKVFSCTYLPRGFPSIIKLKFSRWPSVIMGHNVGYWTLFKWWNIFFKDPGTAAAYWVTNTTSWRMWFCFKDSQVLTRLCHLSWSYDNVNICCHIIIRYISLSDSRSFSLLLGEGGPIDFGDCKLKWHFYNWKIHTS